MNRDRGIPAGGAAGLGGPGAGLGGPGGLGAAAGALANSPQIQQLRQVSYYTLSIFTVSADGP